MGCSFLQGNYGSAEGALLMARAQYPCALRDAHSCKAICTRMRFVARRDLFRQLLATRCPPGVWASHGTGLERDRSKPRQILGSHALGTSVEPLMAAIEGLRGG